MEQIHAELVRLASELDTVRGQVQTECCGLRDLFTRATAAARSQQDGRLNHWEAKRHLHQQFGGSRVRHGDFAFRIEVYAAVLSHDGQDGALLGGGVTKQDKFESDTVATPVLERSTVERRHGCRSGYVHAREGGYLSAAGPQHRPWKRFPPLARSDAMVQTPISGGTSIVNDPIHFAQVHEERERAPSRGHAVGEDRS